MHVHSTTLLVHVRESNAIEGIIASGDDPLYRNHLHAAQVVAKTAPLDPRFIHALIFAHEGNGRATPWRKMEMVVGDFHCPAAAFVPHLMEQWHTACTRILRQPVPVSVVRRAHIAWALHHWFLCIHPFPDGNGRTARLLLNSVRLHLNLPWHIVHLAERDTYYDEIRKWQDAIFVPRLR